MTDTHIARPAAGAVAGPTVSRRLVLTSTTGVALVSTAAAYVAMVAFGRDVLDMSPAYAYSFAGVFELSLVTVALMAREAAQDNRPNATLLTLTWLLSAASGVFAGWHEIHVGHPAAAAAFRFCVPLLAALMWHLALVGDRHLATGRSWSQLRTGARMHALFLTTEAWHRAAGANDGSRRGRRRLERANARRLRARSVALRTVPPTDMDREVAQWTAALEAVTRGTDAAARSASDHVSAHDPGERSPAHPAAHDERSPLTPSAHPDERAHAQAQDEHSHEHPSDDRSPLTTSAHLAAQGERAHPVSAHGEHDDGERSPLTQPLTTSAHATGDGERSSAHLAAQGERAHPVSAHGEHDDERSPFTTTAHSSAHGERVSDPGVSAAARLHAVPSQSGPVSAGPERDALIDQMIAADPSTTGAQVAKALGVSAATGRRELVRSRDRAAQLADHRASGQ
jgi:hypothetical protein